MTDNRRSSGSRRNVDEEKSAADIPPMSRLFIICSKSTSEEDLRDAFKKFGTIEEVWIIKDRQSGEAKGVAYIKFSKTSQAAAALEEMHGKTLQDNTRPIKVLVAANRTQGSAKKTDNDEEKYLRLFVIIGKDTDEAELTEEFNEFGPVEKVTVIRDKVTKEGKGFAYIKYSKFLHAAHAFEGCHNKYKAVFAEPKPSRNSSISSNENFGTGFNGRNSTGGNEMFGFDNRRSAGNSGFDRGMDSRRNDFSGFGGMGQSSTESSLTVLCSPLLNQDQLWRLFDIIPGLDYCQINNDFNNRNVTATVVYNNPQSAAYAKDKIHGLEYPPGERLIIRFGRESVVNMGSGDSYNGNDRDVSICSVPLPPVQPLANSNANCAQRCFVVCTPKALPQNVLKQIFCRMGDLIDIYLLPNKTCGYAKFASEESAKKAIKVLNGAEILGIRLKVLEAEELNNDRRKRMRHEERMADD